MSGAVPSGIVDVSHLDHVIDLHLLAREALRIPADSHSSR